MKKFMIFLLMAFLYLGTSQASNEFTPSSSDVGKSLRHWVSPSVSSSAYAKFKPSSSFVPVASDELTDSVIRVMLVGPTHACPGQTICLTAVVENDYLGDLNYKFRVNGNYAIGGGTDPLYPNRLYVTIDDLGGLDSLLVEYDVEVYSTSHSCKFFRSPAHYVHVYSIHAQLDSVLVCNSTDNGLMCANVFSNGAETPFAYVWYNAATNTIVDTTYVPCKALPVGKYVVEPHFTSNACVTRSDTAEVKVSNGPADGHITMNDITALACNGNQVFAQLSGISANYGAPSIAWSLNGITIPGANDSTLLFSPLAIAGDTTMYILKAEVAYSNYTCKTYTVSDTIQVLDNPTVTIYGDPVVCANGLAGKGLYARMNGHIDNPTYTWKIDGMPQTINDDTLKLSDVSASLTARDYPYEITVAVVGGNSCAALSQAYLLYVNAGPSVVVSTNADTVCKNTEIILTAALADYSSTHLTYKWYRKVGAAGTYTEVTDATTAQYTTVITDSTSYKVEVKETDSECSATDSMTVYTYPDAKPVQQIVLNVSDTTVCSGDQVMFTLVDTFNTKNYGEVGTYMWTMNGVEVDDAEGKTYSFIPTASGSDTTIYNMVVTATYTTTCEVLTSTVEKNIVVVKSPSVVISGDPIICQDSTVVLYATVHDTVPGSPVQYLWRVDGIDSVNQNTKVFSATLPQRDYPYEITVVVDGGGACVAESNVYSVLIGNNPTVAVGVSAPIVCSGNDIVLTAHLGDYNMPNLVYQWSMKNLRTGDSSAIATGTSRELTVALTDSTRFYVRVEQVNSGCFATGDTMVAVYPKPADAKELVLNVDQADACYGAQVTFTAIDTANYRLFGPATYEWSVNGVVVTNASDSVLIFSPEAVDNDSTNYTVHVRAIHTTPCVIVYAEDDTMVTIHRNPSVVISGDPILCQDSTVSLYATVHDTLVGQTVTYLWRVDGVDSVNQNTNHFEATLPQRDYPYEVTVVINAGSACEVVSNVYNVLIGINPTVAIGISAPIVCSGEEATLTAHLGDYNMPNLVYQWYYKTSSMTDSVAIPTGTSRVLTVPVSDTTRYYVRVKQVNSECEAWADTVINVFPQDPAVQPIELLASDSTVCIGGQIAFSVQDTANRKQYFGSDTIPATYRWFVNGFELMTVSGDHFIFSPAAFDLDTTNYLIEVSASYQTECETHVATASDIVTARRNPTVVINGDPMICDTTTVRLVAIVGDTLPGINVQYLWRVDGVDSASMTTNVFETNLPNRDYPYEITVMLNQGSNCEIVSEPFYLYIEDQPEVVVTVDYDTVCKNQVVNLTAHLGNYNQTNLTYQWYVDDTTLVAEGTESTLAYTITNPDFTAFKVVVTQLNSDCQGTGRDTVVTVKNPVLDSIAVTNLQDDIHDAYSYHQYYGLPAYDVCEGASIQVTAYLKDESGNHYIDSTITYKWRRNGEVIEGVNGYRFMEQLAILDHDLYKYVYTVEIDEPYYPNCYSIPTAVHSDTVKVRRNPHVVIGGEHFVCDRGLTENNVLLNAWVDGAVDTGAIYRWYRDGMFEENPYHAQFGAMFLGSFRARYGYNYTFQVEVINGSGCSSWSEPFEVTVMAPPVINVIPYADTVCTGGEVILVSHLDDYNVVDYELQYQWYTNSISDDNLIPGATEAVYSTNVNQTTDYIVKVGYLTENSNMPACVASDTTRVTVYDRPEIDSIIMSLTEICEGAQVQLTAVMDSVHQGVPGVPYIYEWYRNSEILPGNAATIFDAPMTVDGNEQQFTYSVKVYQNPERMMCESPIFVSSQTLTVYPNPIVAIFGDQHVCYTDTIELVANIDTIANPVSTNVHYYWFESGAPIVNINGDSAVLRYYGAAQDEPYRFTVQVERENSATGCRSYSYEYDVWVYDAPVANVTIVDTAVCEGAEVTVTAHLNQNVPEQTNLEYQWFTKTANDTAFVLVPGATELTYTTIIDVTTEFKFEVVHTLSGCFDTDSKTINVHPIPVVNYVSMSDTNVCEGAQVAIYADVDLTKGVAGQPYYFEWRRNGELLPGNTQTIYDSPMTVDGNEQTFVYSVIAYQTPERLACYSELVESATLNVYPNPRVVISGDQYVCETDSVFLYASVDTIGRPVGILHYTWYESGRLRDNMAYGLGDSRYFSEYFYAQDEPYRFTVEVQRDNIAGGCRAYSEEFLVWVYPQPVVNITASETEVCVGGEVTLRANLNNYEFNYANDAQYQWYTIDTVEDVRHIGYDSTTGDYIDSTFIIIEHNPIPGATTLFFNTVMTQTQSFGFTATHNLSGCSDYDEITITVNDIPVIVSVENLSGEDTLCPGGRVELHATVDGGVPGGEVYTWYRNGVALESTGENLIDYPLAVDNNVTMYIYEVVVKQTAAGCESVIDSLSTDTIWVVPNPTIELSGDPIVCDTTDLNIVITANVVSYVDTTGYEYTYQWYENNAPIVGETGLVLSMHKPYRDYPYSFNFEVKNPYGCTVLSEPFLVYVNDNPIVHIAADDTLICENGTVTLTADLYDQNAQNLVYVWYINGDSIPGAYNTTYTTTLTSTSTFTYKAYQRDSHCAAISNEVTVHVVPAPVVENITVVSVDTAICEGHVVTLHANISGGDTTDTPVFTWYKDNEVVEGVTGETFTDYPMSVDNEITTHVYNVTVAQASSACFSLYDVNDEVTITVRPNPRYTIYGDADVCEAAAGYNNIVLYGITNDSIIATAGDYTYTWYESGVVIAGQTTATLSINEPYQTEPYIFKLVVTDNQFGCTAETEDFLVYVSARPIVNVTSTEDTICTNGVVTLTANIYDQNAEYLAYTWYKDSVSESSRILGANDPTYTTAVETTTEFFVVVDQLTTGCQTIASTTVKVNNIPEIVSVENLSGQDTLCPGGRVELHATINGGVAGGEVYTWYRNGVQLESTGENLIDYPAAEDNNVAQYIYEVTVRQTAAACQSVITAASTDTLWIVPNPTIELAGDPIVCMADSGVNNIEITANVVSYLETPYTYQWYENNAPLAGQTDLILRTQRDYRDYPYSFNFAVQNVYGCTVESEPFLVYVNETPMVHITVDDTMICENGTVTLTADLYDQNADNMVYVWYMNNDSIPGAYNTTYTTTLATTATFTFKAYQRDSHCEAISNAVIVNVVPVPVVNDITVVSVDTAICEGHVVSLHANVTGGDNVDEYVYTWYKDNEIVEGATGADYTDYPMSVDNDLTTHIYNVTVAQSSSACFSLYDNATEVEITVRPNPSYTIYGDADVCEEDDITIANINLVAITTDNVIGTTGDYTFTWYESGVEIAGQNTTTLAINEPYRHEPYLFKMIVTDNVYGCSFETEEFAVTVGQKPVVVIAVDQDSICEGGNVTLTSTLMNQAEEGIIYQWQQDVNGNWTDITGAIAPVYVTPALTETTTFRLHVTNTFNGCEANSINDITVTVKPTPVIDIVNVTASVVCNGGEVTLTATSADQYTGLGDIQYQWYNNGQAIFGADQNVYTTSPLTVDGDMTTYTFGVQVIMSNSGCVSNIDTATVTVYADPTVTITYDNGLTLCEGGVTTLTANPNHAYFTDFTYQWYLHGQPINGANNATYVVENLTASANAYDYTVEITVNNGTQNGCSAIAEPVYVTIVNDPTAYITVNEGVNAICEGGTVTFTVNVNDGVADTYNPYTYAWYSNVAGNGVVLGTEASFTTSADDAANLYVYYVDVTSAYGCNVQVSDTLRIVEDPTVTIAVKLGEDTVVCDGGHTTLIATVEGGLGEVSYQWYKNGFAIAGANGNEYVTDALHVNETAAYTVSVSQTGIACTATSTQFNVAVYDAIEVALSANSEVNCVGGTVTLTATTTNGIPGDVLTYQWFRNGNPINGANGAQYVTDENLVAGHYEYQVEVASTVSGCHVAMSSTIGITVEAEPTVMISSDVVGNAICEGGDITLTANVIYATNATNRTNTYTYTWKWYEGTTLRSVTTSEPHYTLPATMTAGSYNFFVEISSNDGLGCDASSQANLFNVVVKPVPSVILTASADESCQGGDVTLNAVVIPSNLSGIFYWNVNGQQIVSSEASITVNNMAIGTNNISVVFAPNDAQVACQSATTTITHVVNAAPVVTVAATDPSRLSMCVGGTITIAATATGTANSSDHYVWTIDGQTQYGNNGNTLTTQLNNAGIHTISAMVERANGCNSVFSTPIAVTVAEQPTAQLTQTAGFAEMCAGGDITLMAKVANYSTVNNGVTNNSVHGTYTYTWYRDNAEFLTTANVTVDNAQITETLNTPAAYTYSVTITASGYNCQAAHATLDHQIRVVPDPSWSVNQVNPTELCIGGIVTLNAEVTGGVENQQAGRIQWYKTFNGVESEVPGLGGMNTDVPQAAGVYTYAPKYIDYIGAGCNIADATATQVTVNDLPTASFTSGHGSVICGHDYQSFATLNISLTGTAPFTFTIMNMTTGESQTIVTSLSVYPYNVSPAVTSIYRIISVSDANGCIGTMDNVADAVVSVSDVQIEDQVVVASCGDYVARIRLQVNASTSTTATATLPDGSTQTVNIMFDAYTQQHYIEVQMPAVAGDYMVNIEVDGCSGDVLVRVPADDVTMGVSSTLVDQRWDDVLVVNNNPDNNGGYKFTTYQWYKNGEMIEGATEQIYQEVGGLGGEYSVELDGIRVSDGAHVHFITCGKYFDAHSSIRVYPVPANTTQEVTVELNLTDEELDGAILDIYDVRGAHVKTVSNLTPITKVGNFGAQGTYFGRIITGTNEIKTVKFIIVK